MLVWVLVEWAVSSRFHLEEAHCEVVRAHLFRDQPSYSEL